MWQRTFIPPAGPLPPNDQAQRRREAPTEPQKKPMTRRPLQRLVRRLVLPTKAVPETNMARTEAGQTSRPRQRTVVDADATRPAVSVESSPGGRRVAPQYQ